MRHPWIAEIVDEIAEHDSRRPDKPSDLQRLFKEALSVLAMGEDDDKDYAGAAGQFLRGLRSCDWGGETDIPDDVRKLARRIADRQSYGPDHGDAMRRRMTAMVIDAVMEDRMTRR